MSHPSGQKVFIIANGRRIKVSLSKQVVMPESTMTVPWPVDLPVELYYHVFKYLPQADLARSCRVNTYCPCCRWGFADEQGINLDRPLRCGVTLTCQTGIGSTAPCFRKP